MFLLMLTLLYNSVTKEQWGTGADTSSDSQPQKTQPVQTWSSQSPASSTAPASPTSTESQVGRFDSETNLWICCYVYVYVLHVYVCVCCRLEYMPAQWKRHLWSGFTVASPGLYSHRWRGCGVAEVRAGNHCDVRPQVHNGMLHFKICIVKKSG